MFPSLREYLDLPHQVGESLALPGRSFAPALVGDELNWGEEITFHEYENTRSVRTPKWKLTRRFPDGPDDLYDLQNDPGERQNVIDGPQYPAIQQTLAGRLHDFYEQYVDPKYDLWHGGISKAGRCIPDIKESDAG